jgi:hypothetical protein
VGSLKRLTLKDVSIFGVIFFFFLYHLGLIRTGLTSK